jgi:phosphoribosylanthranilate isomerase
MKLFRIKICGIMSAQDAGLAASLGADAIGINFYKGSPRHVPVSEAAPIVAAVRGKATPVAVFVNELPEVIENVCRLLKIEMIQLSGHEPPAVSRRLKFFRIKAVHVRDGSELLLHRDYPCDAFLLDTSAPGEFGGTGKSFDLRKIEGIKPGKPWILAGGLNPENVASAIRTSRPDGVDVASGIEKSPGKKDPQLLKSFINVAKEAFNYAAKY